MKPIITLSRILLTARLAIVVGSMFELMAPASAVSMTADKDAEINDRPADMRAIYSIEDRAEAIAEGEKVGDGAIVAGRESIAKWPSLRATLAQKGASAQKLAQMDTRMNELGRGLHDPRGLKRAANDVTGALAPLFRIVGEKIPRTCTALTILDARSDSMQA